MCAQALLECVSEAVGEKEQEGGLSVLLRLSHSLAVQNMTTLHGNCRTICIYASNSSLFLFLPDALVPLCYSTHTNTAALALSTTTNITMETNQATNGVSSSSHVTELTDQVIETLLVGHFSAEVNTVGMRCLLRALVKLSSVSGLASKSAMETLLSLLPQFSGECPLHRAPGIGPRGFARRGCEYNDTYVVLSLLHR